MTDKENAEKFTAEYLELCKKHGLQLAPQPSLKQSMDTGVFGIVVQLVVVEYKEQQIRN